jgi:hypothetical protein
MSFGDESTLVEKLLLKTALALLAYWAIVK